jgi:hypothetical protein
VAGSVRNWSVLQERAEFRSERNQNTNCSLSPSLPPRTAHTFLRAQNSGVLSLSWEFRSRLLVLRATVHASERAPLLRLTRSFATQSIPYNLTPAFTLPVFLPTLASLLRSRQPKGPFSVEQDRCAPRSLFPRMGTGGG